LSGLLIFKRIKLVASTKQNKIIGTQEISFKFPNSAKLLYVEYLQARLLYHCIKQELSYRKKIARQLRTQYFESIYRPKYYTVTLKSRLRSLKVIESGTI